MVSPASSSADWTMRSHGATRSATGSASKRSSAACASSARRRSSLSIQSARSARKACVECALPARVIECSGLRLEPRQVESMAPEGLRA